MHVHGLHHGLSHQMASPGIGNCHGIPTKVKTITKRGSGGNVLPIPHIAVGNKLSTVPTALLLAFYCTTLPPFLFWSKKARRETSNSSKTKTKKKKKHKPKEGGGDWESSTGFSSTGARVRHPESGKTYTNTVPPSPAAPTHL